MSKIEKLYQKLLAGWTLSFSEFERLLAAFGYRFVRQRGSHRIWRSDRILDSRTIRPKGKEAHEYQVEQFLDIIEAYGMTMDHDDD